MKTKTVLAVRQICLKNCVIELQYLQFLVRQFVIETLRHALNTLALVAPEWIRAHVPADSPAAL